MNAASLMRHGLLGAWLTVCGMPCALAQSIETVDLRGDNVFIENEALSGARGRIAVNAASGLNNQQANAASVALGGQTSTYSSVSQGGSDTVVRSSPVNNQAWILGGVLSHSRGLLSINQASGDQNRQNNALAVDVADLASQGDDILAANTAGPALASPRPSALGGKREAGIAEGAFNGANGVLQINQTAGMQNVTSNVIQLRTLGLTGP